MAASFVYLAIYASLSGVFPAAAIYEDGFAAEPFVQKCAPLHTLRFEALTALRFRHRRCVR